MDTDEKDIKGMAWEKVLEIWQEWERNPKNHRNHGDKTCGLQWTMRVNR